jgi:ribonuclease P protein component
VALPHPYRLRSSRDFQRVYSRAKRFKAEHLTLLKLARAGSVASPGPRSLRLGVVVSQKVSKRAVIRNRIRRRLHGAFYQLSPSLASGWDLVLIVHPSAAACDYAVLARELEKLLRRADLNRPTP